MTNLHQIIQNRFIAPLARSRRDLVGVEFEFPVVQLEDRPVDLDLLQEMTQAFMDTFAFEKFEKDDNGRIFHVLDPKTQDSLSYDCSFNTLELSFGTESDMNIIFKRFCNYYTFIQNFLTPRKHMLTGLGTNPNYKTNQNEPIANGRYRMLFHHLSSYPKYPEKVCHNYPNFGMFSCASQVQLDVDKENVLEALNTFSKLEPFNSLLFANSYFRDKNRKFYCSRDYFWGQSMQGYNPHNVGMCETQITSLDELVEYLAGESMYCLERDGKYINFAPTILRDYFSSESIHGEYWNGTGYETIDFQPRPEDIAYHRSYKFEDLTFRGTIEFRSCCEQPVSDVMSVAAYFTGLMEVLPKLSELLAKDASLYRHGYNPSELRCQINSDGLPEFADRNEVRKTLLRILDLAKEGLQKRGYEEEHFLAPLYKRAETFTNPALEVESAIKNGVPKNEIVRRYALMR